MYQQLNKIKEEESKFYLGTRPIQVSKIFALIVSSDWLLQSVAGEARNETNFFHFDAVFYETWQRYLVSALTFGVPLPPV